MSAFNLAKGVRIGDALVFEAENGWISKGIAFLTQSNASHPVMVYAPSTLVETGGQKALVRIKLSSQQIPI